MFTNCFNVSTEIVLITVVYLATQFHLLSLPPILHLDLKSSSCSFFNKITINVYNKLLIPICQLQK